MDSYFFENRDFFANRIQELEILSKSARKVEIPEASIEVPDTAVCVRIRPLTEEEIGWDHIQGVLRDNFGAANIYEPRRKVNGKPDLNRTSFTLDHVYGLDKNTKDIYDDRVQELVRWVGGGGMSMLLAYGQTGSGKTFTVSGMEKLVVEKLMDGKLTGKWDVHMCIFEVAGNNMFDLLNERKPISILEDPFGAMQLVGILEKNPTNSEEFLSMIDIAKELRSTESTTKNDQSSRSHAICRIRVVNKETSNAPKGSFLLVDLAGSEASADTQHHSRERMAETREINKSLTTLKDCIRARALWSIGRGEANQKHVHIPFRSSKLTQVLKSAFDVNNTQTCKTLVIACINPSILDVAHSKNTLRYAEMLKVPVPKAKPRPFDEKIPTTWENSHVHDWITKNSGKTRINPLLLAPRENGLQFCRLQEDEFVGRAMLTPGVKPEQAKLLYYKLWALHIDSRALMNGSTASTGTKPAEIAPKKIRNAKTIKPGMFFRVSEKDMKEGVEIVMAMGLDTTSKGGNNDEVRWNCSIVRPAPGASGAYELFVAQQRVLEGKILSDEMKLEYDIHTRYYLIKGSWDLSEVSVA